MKELQRGKLTIDQLQRLILSHTKYKSSKIQVLEEANIGGDCAVFSIPESTLSVSSDPVTGTEKHIGRLALQVNLNDIVASGSEPFGVLITMLLPLGTREAEVETIMNEMASLCEKEDISILGGHTEVTDAVNRIVLSLTAIGTHSMGSADELKDGDGIYVSKDIALEGSCIIALEKEAECREIFTEEEMAQLVAYGEELSVLPEGRIGIAHGVDKMHDITEGGLLGAVWESCNLMKSDAVLDEDAIPIRALSKRLCERFDINPLRLISSGSMLFFVSRKKEESFAAACQTAGIKLTRIGELKRSFGSPSVYLQKGGELTAVAPPESDELYRHLS